MTPAKDLPMVIEKSQEEIERITELVRASNLPEDIKPFVIGCINLACWIPGALVEHKITVSNLKRLIFGPSFKAILAHMAMPFHRQEHFQSLIGFPIPASTQWQLMEELASSALLVFPTLERLAANGELIHNDDTVLRIVDLIHHNRLNPEQKRTGMFTTGILALNGAYKIALFYNSKRHSGENMKRLLDKRHNNQENVIQMCAELNDSAGRF